ncbi:MAG: helix-turn-helix domain-containing protein [Clostridia bacterium]|nr:helix-turn-helix domain-containing protein [Clostridia bacterium]
MSDSKQKKIYPYVGIITETQGPVISTYEQCTPWKDSKTSFYWVNFEYPLYHTQTHWEIAIVLNDEILHRINGEEKMMTLGMGCVISPKDHHAFYYPNRVKNQYQGVCIAALDSYVREFLGLYSPTLYEELCNSKQPFYFSLSQNSLDKFTNMFLDIQTLKNQSTPYTEQQCNLIFSMIFLKFIEQWQKGQRVDSIPPILKPLIQQLNNPQITNEQIKEAQQNLPYSYPQLTRIFKKYMHCTITQYVNRTKLQYAKDLLSLTDMTLIQITNELNFESPSHFHSLFKKYFNITPAEYRKTSFLPHTDDE